MAFKTVHSHTDTTVNNVRTRTVPVNTLYMKDSPDDGCNVLRRNTLSITV